MLYELTQDDMIEAVQQHLDFDPRYFDQDVGVFEWAGEKVSYVRLPDEFVLAMGDQTITCVRP